MGNHLHMKSNNGLGTLSILSYGKTNMFLRITGKLPTGYHRVFTLMAKVDIFDHITISPLPSGNTKDIVVFYSANKNIKVEDIDSLNALETASQSQPTPEDALQGGTSISKIVNLLRKEYGDIIGLTNQFFHIIVEKSIPQGSGMGGSSSNAHATLQGVLSLMSSTLSCQSKHAMLKRIGTDAPFFLHNKPQLCHGRGDDFLINVDLPQDTSLIVLFPKTANLTHEVYAQYAEGSTPSDYSEEVLSEPVFDGVPVSSPDILPESDMLTGGGSDCDKVGKNVEGAESLNITMDDLIPLMKNDLEGAALAINEELRRAWSVVCTKAKLYNNAHGNTAVRAILNGSGSSISLVCFNNEAAHWFGEELKKAFPQYYVKKHAIVHGDVKIHTLRQVEDSV